MDNRTQTLTSSRALEPASSATLWTLLVLATVLLFAGSAASQTLQNPRRVAEGPTGQVLVTDRGSGSIVAVDKGSLQPAWSFQLPKEGAPFGLATWHRLVFVGNTETKNVEVYRMQGSLKGAVELRFEHNLGFVPAGELGTIGNPISVGIDRKQGLIFVLDGHAKRVKIFDRKGKFLSEFAPVDESGELLSPVSLAVDRERHEVLVSDYGDPSGSFRARTPARILIYDFDGNLLFQINGNRTTHITTQFARVQGLTVSSSGRIFATDPLGSRILVLDRTTGELLSELGTEGSEPGELMLPLDVHLDERSGDLFVSNNQGARKLEALRGVGTQP